MSPSNAAMPLHSKHGNMVVFTNVVKFLPFDLSGLGGPTGSLSSPDCQNTQAAPQTTRFKKRPSKKIEKVMMILAVTVAIITMKTKIVAKMKKRGKI